MPTTCAASTSLFKSSPTMYISSVSTPPSRFAAARKPSGAGFFPTAVALRPEVSSIPIRYMPVSMRSPSVVVHAVLRCIATTGTPCAIQSYTHDNVRWLYSGPAPPSSTTSGGGSGARGPVKSVDDTMSMPVMSSAIWPLLTRKKQRASG